MKKEVLIAIIIGFALGLVITFGIWSANKALKETPQGETSSVQEEVLPKPEKELSLSVSSPDDNFLSAEEVVEVAGKTKSNAIVVILYPDGEKILEADQEGRFSTEISLVGGENQINISAYDQEGNEIKKTLTVVYSTAEI